MQKLKLLNRIISAAASIAIMVSAVPFIPRNVIQADAADIVTINLGKEYQTIRGFGGINLPEWAGSDMTSAQVQKAFGNGKDELGLTILRVYVSDNSNDWGRAVPTALAAQKLGATVFATPWNPPSSIRENGSGGIRGGKYHLKTNKYAEYAQHLNNYVSFMKSKGVDLYSISVQNEPDYSQDWTAWSSDETTNFLANYADKINCRVMSPETFQYTNKDYYTKILNNPKAMANCDLFGTHFYGTQPSQMDFPALENSGKEIWMTEVYVPDSKADSNNKWPDAVKVAVNIHNGLTIGNLNAYVWWYIRRSYGPLSENGTISKRGYCMAQFSKFIRPGDKRVDVGNSAPASNVYVSAYKNNKNQVAIVAVNDSDTGYAQQFSLGTGISDIDRYRTTADESLALTENLENSDGKFWAQLPARSVSTFVVTLSGGTVDPGPDPQPTGPDENGYYFTDTFEADTFNWTGRGEATVLTSGRTAYEGSEALLVQDRTSSWHGGAKSLDSSVFVPGKEYSFSANVSYFDGDETTAYKLTLQYTGSDGEPHYSEIASGTGVKGKWVQLANTNYKIPEDATDLLLYVETTDNSTNNFYIDNVSVAVAGTKIPGAGQPELPKPVIKGDINGDEVIDVFDLIMAKQGVVNGFASSEAEKAADVDSSGKVDSADLVLLSKYIHGSITSFASAVNQWDNYVETASASMVKFYSDSIDNMGNTSRLVSAIEKAESGKKVTVAYLGGSITEGKNYTDPFSTYFKNTFGSNVNFINAGLSGTSSVVGLMRAQRDILDASPDIIFLEFSVNDHPEEIYKKGFESLVKKCLSQSNSPAVIAIINRAQGGYSMQEQMSAIGKNYDIPVISMDKALTNAFNNGTLSKSDYYSDEYHPHANGGKLIADCMAYYFRQALKTANRSGEYKLPSNDVYGSEYSTGSIVSIDELSGFNAGSFKADNSNNRFAYGYTFQKNSNNTPMTFKTTGKGIFVVFKSNQNSSLGNLVVNVNGTTKKISGNRSYAWGGADADVAYIQNTSGELNVSISMENAGTDFNIWGIGVIK